MERGDDSRIHRLGDPRRIDVKNGERMCVQVTEPNTLLYRYTLSATEEVSATPSGYASFLTAIGGLFGSAGGALGVASALDASRQSMLFRESQGESTKPIDSYRDLVTSLAITLPNQATAMITRSDAGPPAPLINFAGVLDSLGRIIRSMDSVADSAAKLRDKIGPEEKLKEPLAALEAVAIKNLEKLREEYVDARTLAEKPVSTTVKDHPTRLYLSAKSIAADAKPKRPVGDSIYAISADPRVTDRTSFSVGGFIVPWVSGRRAFESDAQGVVRETKNQPLDPQVAAFLQVRSGASPFWLALGAGTGPGKMPSYVLGAVWRPQDIVGAKMDASLGVGMVYQTGTIIGLSDPTQLDKVLPAGKSVNDVVQRSKRVGVGVMLSITGLDIESLVPKP